MTSTHPVTSNLLNHTYIFFLSPRAYVFCYSYFIGWLQDALSLPPQGEDLHIRISLLSSLSAGRELPLPPRSTSWRSSSAIWACSAGLGPTRSHGLRPERSRAEQETTWTSFPLTPENRVDEAKTGRVTQNKSNERRPQGDYVPAWFTQRSDRPRKHSPQKEDVLLVARPPVTRRSMRRGK